MARTSTRRSTAAAGCPASRYLWLPMALAVLALAACDAGDLDPRTGLVTEVAGAIPGTDQPYPNLASVPAAPTVTPKAAREQLQKKLTADSKATTYSPDKATAPALPAPPEALPEGFIEARQPVKLPDADPAPGQAQAQKAAAAVAPRQLAAASAAGARNDGPTFGALGAAHRMAIVLFAEGSSAIDPGQVAKLRPLVQRVRREGGLLQLVGHASRERDRGEEGKIDKFDLSIDRANKVAQALVRLGMAEGELVVSAEGDNTPVAALDGIAGETANRRVDIFYED
ncbi:MAG: OmpA family protein [Alphaproteobacteria bacterium]